MPLAGPGGVTVFDVSASGDQRIDALLYGVKWSGPVTFGDPARRADYEATHPEALSDFRQLNAAQIAAARAAYTDVGAPGHHGFSVAGFTLLDISYDPTGDSDIRLADTSDPATAYTYAPNEAGYGGDVFFGTAGRAPGAGNYDWNTTLHELGHALGLKHGNESDEYGALPAATDSMEYSVMTYRSYVGSDARFVYNETWGHAQTYMMYDIAALQYLYGADFTSNAGNTTYTWDPRTGAAFVDADLALSPGANRIFETIWDGNGVDTYDLSNYGSDLHIALAAGGASTFANGQRAYLGGGPNDGFARGNVFNALLYHDDPRSLIENAIGGSGDDTIAGNQANNALSGSAGSDRLFGSVGNDILDGGPGADLMDGGGGNDRYVVDAAADVTSERLGGPLGGTDTVRASVDWSLGANVENLHLVGARATVANGNSLNNALVGNGFADILRGAGGNDRIAGQGGADVLIGGTGADVFRFLSAAETPAAAPDRLRAGGGAEAFQGAGAAAGDLIDFSAIDAGAARPGEQDFVFGAAHAVGHLWAVDEGRFTVIYGNLSGAQAPEIALIIEDKGVVASAYAADDFLGLA